MPRGRLGEHTIGSIGSIRCDASEQVPVRAAVVWDQPQRERGAESPNGSLLMVVLPDQAADGVGIRA